MGQDFTNAMKFRTVIFHLGFYFFLISFYIPISTSLRLKGEQSVVTSGFENLYTTPAGDEHEDGHSKSRVSEILDRVLEESTYDPRIRPHPVNGIGPTRVFVGIYLRSIENVDDVKMQYSVQMTFWQEWVDPRLKYSHHIQKNISYLLITEKKLWLPDIFFRNEKSGKGQFPMTKFQIKK